MKHPFQNRYFHLGVTLFCVIMLSILFFFALFRLNEIGAVFHTIINILQPFIFGFAVAYLLLPVFNTLVKRLQKPFERLCKDPKKARSINKMVSSLISVSFFLAIVIALLSMVLPQLADSIIGLAKEMNGYIAEMDGWVSWFFKDDSELARIMRQMYQNLSASFVAWAKDSMLPQMLDVVSGDLVSSLMSNTVGLLKTVLVGFISAIYMLNSKDTFSGQAKKIIYGLFKVDTANMVVSNLRFVHKVFGGFITGKLIDSLIIGVITFFGLSILKMPYILLISVIIGVTNIIPFFGPFIGAIPSTLLILLVDPIKAIYFVIFILILQQFDGNILGPKILGDSTGLASFWVMFAIILFGGLFGFVGMIVGVPLFAVIYSAIAGLVNRSLRKKNISDQTNDYITLDHINCESGEVVHLSDETVIPDAVQLERQRFGMRKTHKEEEKPSSKKED